MSHPGLSSTDFRILAGTANKRLGQLVLKVEACTPDDLTVLHGDLNAKKTYTEMTIKIQWINILSNNGMLFCKEREQTTCIFITNIQHGWILET